MKKIIYGFVAIIIALGAMAFTEEIKVVSINIVDGTSVEYSIDSIANIGFKTYQGYAYDTSWLDKIYADTIFDKYSYNLWYPAMWGLDEKGDTFWIAAAPSTYKYFYSAWKSPIWWEEVEWYEYEDGTTEKVLNKYSINSDPYQVEPSRLIKNGFETEFIIEVGDCYSHVAQLIHENTGTSVPMYDFMNWGEVNSKYDPQLGPYGVYKGLEITANGSVKKFSYTESFNNDSLCSIEGLSCEKPTFCKGYINANGDARIMPFGMMGGKLGRIPIIDHRREMPSKVIVVQIHAFGSYPYYFDDTREIISYRHPNYEDLIIDAVLATQARE